MCRASMVTEVVEFQWSVSSVYIQLRRVDLNEVWDRMLSRLESLENWEKYLRLSWVGL